MRYYLNLEFEIAPLPLLEKRVLCMRFIVKLFH
jgi:hypothetical protein